MNIGVKKTKINYVFKIIHLYLKVNILLKYTYPIGKTKIIYMHNTDSYLGSVKRK